MKSINPELLKAIENNNLEQVKKLIQETPDLNVQDEDGNTILHYAVKLVSLDTVKELLQKGANPNIKNGDLMTPLFVSAVITDEEKKDFQNRNQISFILLENGADYKSKNKYGITPLHAAAENDNLELLKALVREKNDIQITADDHYWTLLHSAALASQQGKFNSKTIKWLLEQEINPKAVAMTGISVQDIFAQEGEYFLNAYEQILSEIKKT